MLSSGKKTISFMIIKNIQDLSETALSIIRSLSETDKKLFPSETLLNISINALSSYYPSALFPGGEFKYRKDVVDSFNPTLDIATEVYKGLHDNITKKIVEAAKNRDEKYFLDNYDVLFSPLLSKPLIGDQVIKFKIFLTSPSIKPEDKDTIWEFFIMILDLLNNEEFYIENYLK